MTNAGEFDVFPSYISADKHKVELPGNRWWTLLRLIRQDLGEYGLGAVLHLVQHGHCPGHRPPLGLLACPADALLAAAE